MNVKGVPYGENYHRVDNKKRRYTMCPKIGGGTAGARRKANDLKNKISISSSDRRREMVKCLLQNYHGCVADLGRRHVMAE